MSAVPTHSSEPAAVHPVARKLRSARALLRSRGAAGLASALGYQPGIRQLRECQRYFTAEYWQYWDNPVLGRWVELCGNRARVEGCTFALDSPAIPTGLKALFLFDRYERAEREALRRFLDPALPVVELGGSIGVVACLTNRRLADPTRHVVVEANAQLIDVLEANRARNGCGFTVLHRAVAYDGPTVAFHEDADFLAGSVIDGRAGYGGRARRTVSVPTVQVGEILVTHGFERCTVVCDIEGAEVALVAHELDVLRGRVETLIVETHPGMTGVAAVSTMLERLRGAGLHPVAHDGDTYVLQRAHA